MFKQIKENLQFADVKDQLSKHARHLLAAPDYAQVSENLVSMANYLPFLKKLIQLKKPGLISEIGAYKGITTLALAELFGETGCQIDIVDPNIDQQVKRIDRDYLHYYPELSVDYLARDKIQDVVFLDGDHNYETVQLELSALSVKENDNGSPLIFLHDVSWPLAYRDLYYAPERIKSKQSYLNECHLTFIGVSHSDEGLPFMIPIAHEEGGEKNGIMRAVEDFLLMNKSWCFIYIPSIYGLGILYNNNQTGDVLNELESLKKIFETMTPFLATLELNRIQLLAKIEKQGRIWESQQVVIEKLLAAQAKDQGNSEVRDGEKRDNVKESCVEKGIDDVAQ